jgi:hypothetical protein
VTELVVKMSTRQPIGKLNKILAATPALVRAHNADVADTVEEKAKELYKKRLVKNPTEAPTGALGQTFKKDSDEHGATVEFGGDRPYRYWWEWGGSTRSPRGDTERKRMKSGRTVFPAWRAVKKKLQAKAQARLEAMDKATG